MEISSGKTEVDQRTYSFACSWLSQDDNLVRSNVGIVISSGNRYASEKNVFECNFLHYRSRTKAPRIQPPSAKSQCLSVTWYSDFC